MPASFTEEQDVTQPIIMWSGTISDIPAGWVLCDGNNGTPDLTERFLKGTPSAAADTGNRGGADSITLSTGQLPSHQHDGNTSTDGAHTHEMPYGTDSYDFDSGDNKSSSFGGTANTEYSSSDGSHSHTLSLSSTGGDGSIDNRPAYYEVAYIAPT